MSDVAELLGALVACDSTNPQLVPGGAGESAVAVLVADRLRAAGLEVSLWEALPGRASVLGELRGTGGGRTLLVCGHLDVVGADPAAFSPVVRDGRMHGRGASDMKGGLAAAILAAERLAASGPLRGDVLVAGVIDEEWLSAGALDLVRRLDGRRIDGAILPEATGLDVVVEHGGFAWWEVASAGVEAAGDDPDRGVDAIALLGTVLSGLLDLDAELATHPASPTAGRRSTPRRSPAAPSFPPIRRRACSASSAVWSRARRPPGRAPSCRRSSPRLTRGSPASCA